MSSGDFEAQVHQSVADDLALIATAAAAAKSRIVKSVEQLHASEPPKPVVEFGGAPQAAVDFAAQEPAFPEEPVFPEEAAFAESRLPEGAIAFDDLAVESVDDEGIPVWEDPP
jgi:hypothetical protein